MAVNKWKTIINNWVNCYFDDNVDVNIETLVSIISHLRKDSLEITSAVSRSHVLEQFVLEKYPDFIYENGDLELYISASLVLYFVCVNDKDVDMKSVMCKKLKLEDQEIITKFSKTLLKSDTITYKEVEAAIVEACGEDTASSSGPQVSIAETPPALRSLHGDVRKLQAALDAERFDKNFLQEELTRSNHKLQKLLKDKEMCQSEILSLKAKISSCCGHESEPHGQDSAVHQNMMKIVRQLEESEQRLVDTQTQLEDALYERNVYKGKVDELKVERDKWMSCSQQEASRAGTLEEQLITERCNNESLKEIITELRQHNQNNKLDGSMLECDDPNASVHSFGRNLSICSEACSNIVEVQLMEERANIVELTHQIQALQNQLKTLEQKALEEKIASDNELVEKENHILKLLQEIKNLNLEQNLLKESYNDEISKLNNDINELDQKIRIKTESSNRMFQQKVEEIKLLQEDKLSLLHTLSDKTSEFESSIRQKDEQIHKLQDNLNKDQNSKLTMKENYERLIMKFKEKVLNRNNELVELQNTLLHNSEMIEDLNFELQKQRKFTDEIKNKSSGEIEFLQATIESIKITNIAKNDEVNGLKEKLAANEESFKNLLKKQDDMIEEFNVEVRKQKEVTDEIKTKSHDEIKSLQATIESLKITNIARNNEVNGLKEKLAANEESFKNLLKKQDDIIEEFNVKMRQQRELTDKIKTKSHDEIKSLQATIESLNISVVGRDDEVNGLKEELAANKESWQNLLKKQDDVIEEFNVDLRKQKELTDKIETKSQDDIKSLQATIESLNITIVGKDDEVNGLKEKLAVNEESLQNLLKKQDDMIEEFNVEVRKQKELTDKIKAKSHDEFNTLQATIESLNITIIGKDDEVNGLKEKLAVNEDSLQNLLKKQDDMIEEFNVKMRQQRELTDKIKTKSHDEIKSLQATIESLNISVVGRDDEVNGLKEELAANKESWQNLLKKQDDVIEEFNVDLRKQKELTDKIETKSQDDIKSLQATIESLNITIVGKDDEVNGLKEKLAVNEESLQNLLKKQDDMIEEFNVEVRKQKELTDKIKAKSHDEFNTLQATIESLNITIIGKNDEINGLKGELADNKEALQSLLKNEDDMIEVFNVELCKQKELTDEIIAKSNDEIKSLQETVDCLKIMISGKNDEVNDLKDELAKNIESLQILLQKENEYETKLDKVKQTVIDLENMNKKLNDEYNELNDKKIQIENDLSAKVAHLSNVEDQFSKHKDTLECELKETSKLFESLQVNFKDKCESHNLEKIQIEQDLLAKNQELEYKAKQLLALQQELTQYKQNIGEKIDELRLMEEKYEEVVKIRTCLDFDNKKLKESVEQNIKIVRQLEESEQRLVITQTQLENALYERDNYKGKVDELKMEGDKWMSSSQQEASRAGNLEEQLNTERCNNKSLKEMVTELRKQNNLNDILEAQLTEERANIVELTNQVQVLQNQLKTLEHKSHEDKIALDNELVAKENYIQNLLQEIQNVNQEQNLLKESYNDEISKLNNGINELEQKMEVKTEASNKMLHEKVEEIKLLHEDKLSLSRTLSDKTTEFESRIREMDAQIYKLQDNLNKEQSAKLTMKENYEPLIMEFKEKVLNKNNELVELQNTLLRNSDMIEGLNVELQKQKKLKDELETKSYDEIKSLQATIESLNMTMTAKNDEFNGLKEELALSKESLQKLLKMEDENNAKFDKVKQTVIDLENINKKLNNEYNEINDQKCQIESELSAKVAHLSNVEEQLSKRKETLECELKETSKQFQTMQVNFKDKCESLNLEKIQIEQDLHSKNLELESQAKQLLALKQELTQYKQMKQFQTMQVNFKDKCESLDLEKIQIEQDLHSKNLELESQAKQLLALQQELTQYKQMIGEKINELHLMEEKYNEVVKVRTCLDFDNKKLNEFVDKLKVDIERQGSEISVLNMRLQDKDNIILQKKCLEEKQRSNEFEQNSPNERETIADLEKIILDKNRIITTLQSDLTYIKNLMAESESKLLDVSSELDVCKNNYNQVNNQFKKVIKDVEEKDALLKSLQNKLQFIQDQAMNNLKTQLVNKDIELKKTKDELNEEVKLRANMENDIRKLMEEKQCLSTKLVDLVQNLNYDGKGNSEQMPSSMGPEDIISNKNQIIIELQSDITYLKTLLAESENNLSDVNKELEVSRENYAEVSNQLKKLAHVKNEEIADLRKQISKMSVTENRATQIIKVSAKYQGMILKRIAEIKNVGVLKELTNFGNVNVPYDSDIRKSLSAGAITMEDLENFLETTDKHLRKCSEKQLLLQKERDRLAEVCKINDSEIINMKKYLTELSVYYKTFGSIKELYNEKLTRVVSIQRRVRRDILNLEGHVREMTMAKLERNYAAVIQDLCECAMNFERWAYRSIGRTVTPEKIMQAFTSELPSLSSGNFQNTGLEVQIDEIEKSFVKLLEEISRAQRGEVEKDAEAVTVMEVRAEYEDKLNRMKAKMKQLYQEQITIFREKQKEEIALLEKREQEALKKLAESSREYEEHIKGLSLELWHVGEKYLLKSDEADWLRKKQTSGSLMSLQHVNSSGLGPFREDKPRPSDTYSLRSLPINKRDGRGLHMSDEEGEVFDNRCLNELVSTPKLKPKSPRASNAGRFSELKWRNSLCPPHLKSSYPAETQFTPSVDEDDIKCLGRQRKEVGITAYKKPGPPTPSKQAGRLSATDSELRESLRPDAKKTATPSRIRALFRSRNDTDTTGTPRRRLSIFRSKK